MSSAENNTDQGPLSKQEFKLLFDEYFVSIRNFVYGKVGDVASAEDISQEVFLKIWEKRNTIDRSTVKALLYTIARNTTFNKLKRRQLKYNFIKSQDERKDEYSPESKLIEKEFSIQLENAISSLSEKEQEVFLMSRMEDMSYKEIAERLDLSVKAIEKRMSKALAFLKERLGKGI